MRTRLRAYQRAARTGACALLLAVCAPASTVSASSALAEAAQPGTGSVEFARELINAPVRVQLTNGNVLTGVLADIRGGEIVIEHELLGEIAIPRIAIDSVQRDTAPVQPEDGIEQETPGAVPVPSPEGAVEPALPPDGERPEPGSEAETPITPPPPEWNHRFRLGLNGTQGPTDQFDIRTSLASDRTTRSELLSIRLSYQLSEREGTVTRDRFVSRVRQEWGRDTRTPWSMFAEGEVEIDQIRDEDARVRGTAGLSYLFFKDDQGELSGRVGLGGSLDVGGEDDSIEPEALLALSFSRKLTERQTVRLSGELFPLLDSSGDFRANARGAWEIALTEDGAVTLRLGGENRYDSTRETDQSVVDYFAEVQWTF